MDAGSKHALKILLTGKLNAGQPSSKAQKGQNELQKLASNNAFRRRKKEEEEKE